jgi:iron complex outermembrane receptor protein
MNFIKYISIGTILLTTLATNVFAKSAEELFELSLEELMQVDVQSVSKRDENILESPSAISIMTKQEIELLRCDKLSQCLEFGTGLSSINSEGNIFYTTTIRGNTQINYNTNTLFLINGVPVYNSYHGSFNIDTIPVSAVERIEILKGSNSVLYGTNAINGAINIITKVVDGDELMFSARYGSFETSNMEASFSKAFEDGSIQLFTQRYDTDAQEFKIVDEHGNTRDFNQATTIQNINMLLKIDDFDIYGQYFERKLDNYKTRGFVSSTGLDAKEENFEQTWMGYVTYRYNLNSDFEIKLKTTYNDWELKKDRYNGHWDYSSYWWYNELELHMFEDGENANILGASYDIGKGRRYKSDKSDYDIGHSNKTTKNVSVYDNGNYYLVDYLNFVYGIRYSESTYYSQEESKDIDNDNTSVRFGLVYTLDTDVYLKALYGESYRVPTYFEKEVGSLTTSPSSGDIVDNPELTPEESKSYDLILSHQYNELLYSIDLFYTEIDDKINRVDIGGGVLQNQNIGDISMYGLEIDAKFRVSDSGHGFANYAYTKSNDEAVKFIYEHMFTLGYAHSFNKANELDLSTKILSSWGEADSYMLLNMAYVRHVQSIKNLDIEFIGRNLLDDEIDLPEIGRDKEAAPIVPSDHRISFYMGIRYSF